MSLNFGGINIGGTSSGGSNSSYIPANTTYNIKTDGTGDFATIVDALEFLKGKWSDGKICLSLDAGTHSFANSNYTYSGMYGSGDMLIYIKGVSKNSTIIDFAGKSLNLEFANFIFSDIQLYDSTHSTITHDKVLTVRYGSDITFQNVKFVNGGVQVYKNATVLFDYGNEIHNTGSGIMTTMGGKTIIANDILCKDVRYCFCIDYGGHLSLANVQLSYKNVTKYFGLWRTTPDAHFSQTGVIYSGTGDGIICGYLTATEAS